MYHYASPLLKVSFDGPDLRDETLYNLMRVRKRYDAVYTQLMSVECTISRMGVS